MGRRSGRGDITRHYDIDAAPTLDQVRRAKATAAARQLPGRGTNPSTDRMLDAVDDACAGQGTGYSADKIYDWMRRLPLRAVAALVEPWRTWRPELLVAVAESVLMHGHSSARTAVEYGTTPETVDAIVADYRRTLRQL
jgi:hypothetical protein